MNILSLLDVLEDELAIGTSIPFTKRTLVNRDKCLDIIKDIRLNMPEEIKQAEWLKMERQKILIEAQDEAETIIKEAEHTVESLIDEDEITQGAYQQARDIMESCQDSAKEIRLGSREYADELLGEVESFLIEQIEVLRRNRQELDTMK
ncbi:MAG TPA: ATPase [Clostridia bacterium]|nr:ATPase [Clostridia bacterium]